jgi:hypothetical protein
MRIGALSGVLAAILALAACTPPTPQTPKISASAAAACRVGPDGGPAVADRGIGGTGGPERRMTDRGIGGTGIIGVITGFGSVCVNGFEVAYDPAASVSVDGRPDGADVLRVGQLAAIEAGGSLGAELQARRVAVRHEVVGPVEAPPEGAGLIRVAGQIVVVPSDVQGNPLVRRDDWVAVSGLRSRGGRIVATRIDVRTPGRAVIHGRLEREPEGAWRIDGARIQLPDGAAPVTGRLVQVSGTYADGLLRATAWEPDLLASDPAAYFGAAVDRLSVEQFVGPGLGGVSLGDVTIAMPSSADASRGRSGPAIVDYVRGAGGRMAATSLREAPGGIVPNAAFTPAPVPGPATLGSPFGGGGGGPGIPGAAGRMPFPASRPAPPGGVGAGPPPSAPPGR